MPKRKQPKPPSDRFLHSTCGLMGAPGVDYVLSYDPAFPLSETGSDAEFFDSENEGGEYDGMIEDWAKRPEQEPVVLCADGHILDGWHRLGLANKLGWETIPAWVVRRGSAGAKSKISGICSEYGANPPVRGEVSDVTVAELEDAMRRSPGRRTLTIKGQRVSGLKPIGSRFWFEYHCNESHDSADAELWYHSHQRAEVVSLEGSEPPAFTTERQRSEAAIPLSYQIRFDDGSVFTAVEDELFDSPRQFFRPDPPKRTASNPPVQPSPRRLRSLNAGRGVTYLDIAHRGGDNVLWIWRDGQLLVESGGQGGEFVHSEVFGSCEGEWFGRFEPGTGRVSASAPSNWKHGIPHDLRDALKIEFGEGSEIIEFNPPPVRFWGRSGAGILFHCTGDDTYLLTLRSEEVEQPGTLGIPGGACGEEGMFTGKEGKQIGESQAWACAMRETKEELSWWPKQKQVVQVVLFQKANFQYQTFIVDIPASEKAEAERSIKLNWENDDHVWMSIPEMVAAREQLHFGMQHVLEQIGG